MRYHTSIGSVAAWGSSRVTPSAISATRSPVGVGAAGFAGTRLAAGVGVPLPVDILAGGAVTGALVLATGLISAADVRRVVAGLAGREYSH